MQFSPKVLGGRARGERLQRILQSPNYRSGRFVNLLPTKMGMENEGFVKTMRDFATTRDKVVPPGPLPTQKSDLRALSSIDPVVVWLGHSSYLLKYQGKVILVDPVLSAYASPLPVLIKAFAGTMLFSPDEIPEVDVLLITHDHYDHLDYPTIKALRAKVHHVVAPLGVGAHFERWGYDPRAVTELDWHESYTPWDGLHIHSTPARHFSGRGLGQNQTLWSSYALRWNALQLFVGGDSGYGPHFGEIGERFGGFDLAFVECGQYNVNWPSIHASPEDSAQAGVDLRAKVMMPVHWSKFPLAFHTWNDPALRVVKAAQELGLNLTMPKIGEAQLIGGPLHQDSWWQF